ncbi:MAG TPA: phytanoyl-CoA dioxygenase family protein [Pseudomonadales bacterium]|nr:phytanoyl-CoA dioxygenase family protein [Pseudomonadales bacterium]
MRPVTAADREHLIEHGWLVVPDVVPKELCERSAAALCDFIAVDPDDRSTWSNYVAQGHGIIPLHHHQALWDVRQLPQLHALFSALHGDDKLWVTFDRGSFKVPSSYHESGFRMDAVHWDSDPRTIENLTVQALVYLTDTPPQQGAFAMVPELYATLDEWLAAGRTDAEARRPDVSNYPLVPLGGAQGSVVVWHRRMPHTSLANNSDRPRLVQYVTMNPVGDEETRLRNAKECLEKRPPAWAIRQNVRGQQNPEPGPPVDLTPLGRKLAGVDRWA